VVEGKEKKRVWTELLAPLNASSATALRALSGCKTLAIWPAGGCAAGVSEWTSSQERNLQAPCLLVARAHVRR